MGVPPGHDDDSEQGSGDATRKADADRSAVLARRQRFIALALTGLATAACDAKPQPCLDVAAPEGNDGKSAPADGGDDMRACLKIEVAPDDEGGAAEAGAADDGVEAVPTPCLEVAVEPKPDPDADPTPSIKEDPPPEAPPRPCLKVRPPDPPPEPAPTPCLRVAAPKPDDGGTKPKPCLRVSKPRD